MLDYERFRPRNVTMAEYLGFVQKFGMKPAEKVATPGGEILIADGYSPTGTGEYEGPHYKVAWAILRDKFDVGRILYFAPEHNPELDANAKRKARLNAAIKEAVGFIKQNMAVGRYV